MADQQAPPDHTDDPRKQGTGQGYPETAQEEATPHEGTESGPEAGRGGADAPDTSTDQERDREASTGNPDAAG
jgi:hypothetical protein